MKRYAAWIATLPIIGLRGKVHKQTELRDNAVGRSERNALAHAGSVLAACAVPDPQSHGLESQDDVDKFIFILISGSSLDTFLTPMIPISELVSTRKASLSTTG